MMPFYSMRPTSALNAKTAIQPDTLCVVTLCTGPANRPLGARKQSGSHSLFTQAFTASFKETSTAYITDHGLGFAHALINSIRTCLCYINLRRPSNPSVT